MKIAYITAGAAGMYCGSCMLDNALARALIELGHDCLLVPLYTPIRTDEESVSIDQVFYGGVNVYLQQKLPFLKWLPRWLDASLNNARLVKMLTANAGKTSPKLLGEITVSMLAGTQGKQRKEALRLCDWLEKDIQPDCVVFSNFMIAGVAPLLRERLQCKVWVVLQGDDIFIDTLPETYQRRVEQSMQRLVPSIDGFIVHSNEYAQQMGQRLRIPSNKQFILPLGIDTRDLTRRDRVPSDSGFRIGYLARIAPEKGIQRLVHAFCQLGNEQQYQTTKLVVAGYLGPQHRAFWQQLEQKISQAGLSGRVTYLGEIDRQTKAQFLTEIDLLCVPTVYKDPKGLFVLEAVAAGTPYLLPSHGAFTELHARLQFGWLFPAGDDNMLLQQLRDIVDQSHFVRDHPEAAKQRHQELLQEIDIRLMAQRKLEIMSSKP